MRYPFFLALASVAAFASTLAAQFTYQGHLQQNGEAYTGDAAFVARLYSEPIGGSPFQTIEEETVTVDDGLFLLPINGISNAAFGFSNVYLELAVRIPASDEKAPLETLTTRQLITPAYKALDLDNPVLKINRSSSFVGVNRTTPITGAEKFGIETNASSSQYGGMYITGGNNSWPFYGYAPSGNTPMWTYYHGAERDWRVFNGGDRFTVENTGEVGIGTIDPQAALHIDWSSVSDGRALDVVGTMDSTNSLITFSNTSSTQTNRPDTLNVTNAAPKGTAIFAWNTATQDSSESGRGRAIEGRTSTPNSIGVYGLANPNSTGLNTGVLGELLGSVSDESAGVTGRTFASNGQSYGVFGETFSTAAPSAGVFGRNNPVGSIFAWSYGVLGINTDDGLDSAGVRGISSSGADGHGYGVYGSTNSQRAGYAGVFGENSNLNTDEVVNSYGVVGRNGVGSSGDPAGVYGFSGGVGTALPGRSHGVYGRTGSNGTGAAGVLGRNSSSTPRISYGVHGINESSVRDSSGVFGESTSPTTSVDSVHGVTGLTVSGANFSSGVRGLAQATSGNGIGVYGSTQDRGWGGYFTSNPGGIPLRAGMFSSTNSVPTNASLFELWTPGDRQFVVATDGDVFADGTFNPGGADFAELLDADQSIDIPLEPTDVLAIDPESGELTRSTSAYQRTVVGVYATKPGILGGAVVDGEIIDQTGKVPLAVVGIVPVKACDQNGPIQPGDMLVASDMPGYAMRAGDNPPNGSVIGKALSSLDEETGEVKLLVVLQ